MSWYHFFEIKTVFRQISSARIIRPTEKFKCALLEKNMENSMFIRLDSVFYIIMNEFRYLISIMFTIVALLHKFRSFALGLVLFSQEMQDKIASLFFCRYYFRSKKKIFHYLIYIKRKVLK